MKTASLLYLAVVLTACAAVSHQPHPSGIFGNNSDQWRESRGLPPVRW